MLQVSKALEILTNGIPFRVIHSNIHSIEKIKK